MLPQWILVAASVAALVIWFLWAKSRRRTHPVSGGLQLQISLPHEQDVELYHNSFSHCSRKARLVLAELGIPYKDHQIDLIETGWYETISPAYLKINRAGLLPTLVHQGHPIYESDDILAYAQQIAGPDAPTLVPEDQTARAEMDRWLAFGATSSSDPMGQMATSAGSCIPGLTLPLFITAIRTIPLRNILIGFLFHADKRRPALFTAGKLLGLRRMAGLSPLQELAYQSRDHMARHLRDLERHLAAQGPWLLGDQFSLADISMACLLLRLDETGWLAWLAGRSDMPALHAYYQRLQARPSWQQAIASHAHPIVERAKADLREQTQGDQNVSSLVYGS